MTQHSKKQITESQLHIFQIQSSLSQNFAIETNFGRNNQKTAGIFCNFPKTEFCFSHYYKLFCLQFWSSFNCMGWFIQRLCHLFGVITAVDSWYLYPWHWQWCICYCQ